MAADQSGPDVRRGSLLFLCFSSSYYGYHGVRLLHLKKEKGQAEPPLSYSRLVVLLLEGCKLASYSSMGMWMGSDNWGSRRYSSTRSEPVKSSRRAVLHGIPHR